MNKKGSVIPIRTSGSKKKGGLFWAGITLVAGTLLVMGTMSVYNSQIKTRLPSSLNDGKGATNEISGATGQVIDSNRDLATFSFSVVDNVNDNSAVTTGIPIGAVDSNGKERINPTSSFTNQTITSIPENTVLSFYGGGAGYYLEPKVNYAIEVGDMVSLTAAPIQTEANMLVSVYDNTGSTALTAGNSSQAEDYTMALGDSQSKTIYVKLTNNAADAVYQLKAICTGYSGVNVSSFEIQGSDWSKVSSMSDLVSDAEVTYFNGQTSNSNGEYKECFVYKAGTNEALTLDAWDDTPLIKAVVKAKDGKNPGANLGENIYFTMLDGSWAKGSDGKGHFDFYQHDGNEGNVGLSETLTSPTGTQLGALIELS